MYLPKEYLALAVVFMLKLIDYHLQNAFVRYLICLFVFLDHEIGSLSVKSYLTIFLESILDRKLL